MERTSGNDVGTGPRPRSRECDSLLLVAWEAPSGVVGNGAKLLLTRRSTRCSLGLGVSSGLDSTIARYSPFRL